MVVPAHARLPIVADIGSASTKLGFGGNLHPCHEFPSRVDDGSTFPASCNPACHRDNAEAGIPLKSGATPDWGRFESFMASCLCGKLQVDSREHAVLLTEAPKNPPENREAVAEIMFETFQVPALHIGVQGVLALYSLHAHQIKSDVPGKAVWDVRDLQGSISSTHDATVTIVDAGDSATHVLPIVDGYAVRQGVRTIPLGGAAVTALVQAKLRDRGEPVPQRGSLETCRDVKERFGYACRDIAAEFARLDEDREHLVKHYTPAASNGSAREYGTAGAAEAIDVAYERFLGPEVYFQPAIAHRGEPALPDVIDGAIQSCPIDSKRKLYNNVYLTGGSSLFRNFDRRLKLELQARVDERLSGLSSGVTVSVHRHPAGKHAVWLGGSMLSVTPQFPGLCHTRAQYEEYGPSICRRSHMMPQL